MDNAQVQKLRDFLAKNDKVAVAVGRNPSLDDMGAALALYLGLQKLGKSVSIASPSDPIVEISSLVAIDKVATELQGDGGDLVVAFPYREGEIEKVSYTIENGYLNIVVKAGQDGLTFDEKDIKYKRGGGAYPGLIFVVGTPRLSDLGSLFNPEAMKDTAVVNIDNKNDNQGFGDVILVTPRYSSVSEQMAQLLVYLKVDIDIDMAQNLLSGISHGTNNFQKLNTSAAAFEMTALLLKKGAMRPQASLQSQTQPPSFVGQNVMDDFGYIPQPQPSQRRDRQDTNEALITQKQDKRAEGAQQPAQQAPAQENKENESKNPPPDWLMPKVYRGSTTI